MFQGSGNGRAWLAVMFGAGALVAGFASVSSAQKRTLTVITHDSFNLSKTLVQNFERQNGISVRFVKGGDAGAMTNKLILSKRSPVADAVYGIDNTLLSRALDADILEAYKPGASSVVPKNYVMDAAWRITPVNYGFVALNYDKAWFAKNDKPLPSTLEDLLKPEFKGLLVAPNPATSSPGLAFYLATIKTLGETGALRFWAGLRDNDVKIVSGWDAAYYTEFTKNGGSHPIVVSYASSPAAEVFFSEKKLTEAPTANLLLRGSSYLQIEGIAVLKGAKNRDLARKFVEFMLRKDVQQDIPTQMWVYGVRQDITLNDVYRFAQKPRDTQVAALQPTTVGANGTRWVQNWTRVVLQGADPSSLR
jgi:thiamine transport system substrate-binding protein